MLYEEITTGAVVVGFAVDVEEMPAGDANAMDEALEELNAKHGQKVVMFVAGDSVTDHADCPEEPLYAYQLVFGLSAVMSEASDGPCEVSLEKVDQARGALAEVPAAFWADLSEKLPAPVGEGEPKTFHMSFGPLPFSALVYGRIHPSAQSEAVKHKFFSCQDMDQQWTAEGVDGVRVSSVEYADIAVVDLSAAALEAVRAEAGEDARLYMTVRYD